MISSFSCFSKNQKTFGENKDKSIVSKDNREGFIDMITSKNGYFLLNHFRLSAQHQQLRLDDIILEAQLNGKNLV